MITTEGYALLQQGEALKPWTFQRRAPRADDVVVEVLFCGVCHSDLHKVEAASAGDLPLVPGHEFTGRVVETGAEVTRFAPGDMVAVGNVVDSCGRCEACLANEEVACAEFPTLTYGGRDRHDGTPTHGGYATTYVARDRFVYHLPAGLDLAAAAPLMCAGATVWDPLRRWRIGDGHRVGVVGLGGLGHLAVKLAAARGADVTVFTTSAGKAASAAAMGASSLAVSTDDAAMARSAGALDFMLDTVSAPHDVNPYLRTLRRGGTLCMLGLPERYQPGALDLLGKTLTASGSAGTTSVREMLDFCARHQIGADVEVFPIAAVNTALDRLARNDVRYRAVLDLRAP